MNCKVCGKEMSEPTCLLDIAETDDGTCSSCRARCPDCGKLRDRHAEDCPTVGQQHTLAASYDIVEFMTLHMKDKYRPAPAITGALLGVAQVALRCGYGVEFVFAAAAMLDLAAMMKEKKEKDDASKGSAAEQEAGSVGGDANGGAGQAPA